MDQLLIDLAQLLVDIKAVNFQGVYDDFVKIEADLTALINSPECPAGLKVKLRAELTKKMSVGTINWGNVWAILETVAQDIPAIAEIVAQLLPYFAPAPA